MFLSNLRKKGVKGFVSELWEMPLKNPHSSNSSNFAASFLVNEYYNAPVKGIKNLMDFCDFFL